MKLPDAWVDRLFDRLGVRYGAAFHAMYAQASPAAVKEDWAVVLGGLTNSPQLLAYGLDNLPEDRPPTAMQFRAICNRGPVAQVKLLEEPRAPMPEAVQRVINEVADDSSPDYLLNLRRTLSPAEYTIKHIEYILKTKGRKMSSAQKAMIESCRRVSATVVDPKSPEGMADRQRTDALKEAAGEAVAAYASSRGIDLAGASDRPGKGRYRPGANPMQGAWGPGFGPQEAL